KTSPPPRLSTLSRRCCPGTLAVRSQLPAAPPEEIPAVPTPVRSRPQGRGCRSPYVQQNHRLAFSQTYGPEIRMSGGRRALRQLRKRLFNLARSSVTNVCPSLGAGNRNPPRGSDFESS